MRSVKEEILQFSRTTLLRNKFLNGKKFVIVSKSFWVQGSEVVPNCKLFVSNFHQSAISQSISECISS